MAQQKHNRSKKKDSKLWYIISILGIIWYVISYPFTKDFWYKRIPDDSPFKSFGRSYPASYIFRWQRLYNLIVLITVIVLITIYYL